MVLSRVVVIGVNGEVLVELTVSRNALVRDIMKSTRRALGHGKICGLLEDAQRLGPLDMLAQPGSLVEHRLTAVVTGTLADLRASNQDAADLRDAGYTADELKDAGFSVCQLRNAGFGVLELQDAGFTERELKGAGFGARQLKKVGCSAQELKTAGYSWQQLKDAGYTAKQLTVFACDVQKLQDAYCMYQCKDAASRHVDFSFLRLEGEVLSANSKHLNSDRYITQASNFGTQDLKQVGVVMSAQKQIEDDLAQCSMIFQVQDPGFSAKHLARYSMSSQGQALCSCCHRRRQPVMRNVGWRKQLYLLYLKFSTA